MNDLRQYINKLQKLTLTESARIPHPEDKVFATDIAGAKEALKNIVDTVKDPKSITIKWDGYPALVFGRGPDNKFSIMDKHMFNKKDGSGRKIYSPKDFINYDKARGVERTELHNLVSRIWNDLEQATRGLQGYYWGDLLFGQKLNPVKGEYVFKANPNGVTYHIKADSDVGKMLDGKHAAIAVHQYMDPNAVSTDNAQSLQGTTGKLPTQSNVAFVPSAMPVSKKLKLDTKKAKAADDAIMRYGSTVKKFMDNAPQARTGFGDLFRDYVNRKVESGNLNNLYADFLKYVQSKPMTEKMRSKISDYLNSNQEAVKGLFTIWMNLYNLKMDVYDQLEKITSAGPIQGKLSDGSSSQEGFVSKGVKFVNRPMFFRLLKQGSAKPNA